ncbi:MAG: type IV-A pilus assembly ATPase PilB [Candidatus Latescibacterota bacterium]|nr:MAG: type IV-A pilus assembly ATPase PilB [Candidatus Latescibacterota bacterium]
MSLDLAEVLFQAEVLSPDQYQRVRKQRESSGDPTDSCLTKLGILSEQDLLEFLSRQFKVPQADLKALEADRSVVDLVPHEICSRFNVIPIRRQGRALHLAMADPTNIYAVEDIKFLTGLEIQPVVATESRIREAIGTYYDNSSEALENLMKDFEEEDVEILDKESETDTSVDEASDAPVVKLVNSMIAEAVHRRASDIHVEPFEKQLRVRFRIDGTLYTVMAPPVRMRNAIASRVKIMASLDIAEKRTPQDGNIKIRMHDKTVDLRVSTLPTIFGEKIVMRVLDQSNLNVDLSKLGFEEVARKNFERAIRSPWGMVLVTGPTGSGKTTTLYSALSTVNSPDTNIMSAEDPVEYNLDGINQVGINEAAGLTFASALRAFLRQDPNIIMVGEVRDIETAGIAVKAALTGHLVLSTLHTNDAPSTINRLIDMGVEPFLVSSSVRLILAQRLIRRVCSRCAEEFTAHPEALAELGVTAEWAATVAFKKGRGCDSCNGSGYSGRQGLFEVLPITSAIGRLILDRRSADEIRAKAVEEGMLTLRQDGIRKIQKGITTIEEVLRETSAF